ncbi:sensor histidine kinase, partial [Sphaerochaeta sp. S2]|uniref:sensor histidine kinase n=1 Tax=Sphaerochaeta sp. S2 TaxID=2798868 RepID=UPI001E40156C
MFNSIRSRLISLILMYLLLVIILVTLLISATYMRDRRAQSELYVQQRINNAIELLDTVIYRMDTLATQLLASNTLQEMFFNANRQSYTDRNYFEHNLEQKKIAQDILWAFNSPNTQAQNVSIFSDSTYLGLRYTPTVSRTKEVSSWDMYRVDEDQNFTILPPHQDYWGGIQEQKVFSLVRPFIGTNFGFIKLGTIEVMESASYLEEIFAITESETGLSFLVIDGEGNTIHATSERSREDIVRLQEVQRIDAEQDIVPIELSDGSYMLASGNLSSVGWDVFLIQPESLYNAPLRTLIFQLLALFLALTACIFIIMIIIVNRVTLPLEQLIEDIDSFSLYEEPTIHECSLQEVSEIQQTFLRLVSRLRESADKLLIANETELNLRIMTLQAKINPHFLFNSLTAISAVASEEGAEKVPVMCRQLSELFRYTSSGNEGETTLANEIDNVRTYMEFMTWRFEDFFSYSIDVQGDTNQIYVPKLILQPLVENAFTHGFKNAYPPYRIQIACNVASDGWNIRLEDNGPGFSPTVLSELNLLFRNIDQIIGNKLDYKELKAHDMALVNIYIRLRLQYKERFSLRITDAKPSKGSVVMLWVEGNEAGCQ